MSTPSLVRITIRGLPGVVGDVTFSTDTPEDGVMVLINDHPVVAVDLTYCGLPLDDEVPHDPCDPDNVPKIVVGAWPDGDQWERIHTIPMSDTHKEGS